MTLIQMINGAVVLIGIPTIAGVLISVGKRLKTLEAIEEDMKDNIRPDLKEVRERFFALEGRLAGTFGSASPILLKEKGIEILEKSGLKRYIDENRQTLLERFRSLCGMDNQYDIQERSFAFFDELDFGDLEDALKKGAFDYGMDMATARRIGGIYFRDIALLDAGFTPEDLDKDKKSID